LTVQAANAIKPKIGVRNRSFAYTVWQTNIALC